MESIKDANTVHYHIYPTSSVDIEKLQLDCLTTISPHLAIIWNTESFTLQAKTLPTPHLSGQLWFDNSLEDEWYVIWLLKQITANHSVVAKVWDEDGDIVLIEAAHIIPTWLGPDNSDNRLLIHGGKFILIPQPETPSEMLYFPTGAVTLHQAIQAIPHIDPMTGESRRINEAVEERFSKFPERGLHQIRCKLPLPLIHALHTKPNLISSLLSLYFYADNREKQQVIKAHSLDWEELVKTNVMLTRCQYAQIYSQKELTCKAWPHVHSNHADYLDLQLGLKIALGAELALSIAKGTGQSGSGFTKYLKKLEKYGYFNGNIEGSKGYKELYEKAELFHLASNQQTDGSIWLDNSRALDKLVGEEFDQELYCNREVKESEVDSWMDVMPPEIEKWFLEGRGAELPPQDDLSPDLKHKVNDILNPKADKSKPKPHDPLSHMNEKLQGFVENISSYEGAEVPDDIEFDVDDFMSILTTLKDKLAEKDGTESDDTSSLCTESEEEMDDYLQEMEEELKKTTLSDGFEKREGGDVDIDLNLVSNILQSCSSHSGMSGPASNILSSLGVHLPRDEGAHPFKPEGS